MKGRKIFINKRYGSICCNRPLCLLVPEAGATDYPGRPGGMICRTLGQRLIPVIPRH